MDTKSKHFLKEVIVIVLVNGGIFINFVANRAMPNIESPNKMLSHT